MSKAHYRLILMTQIGGFREHGCASTEREIADTLKIAKTTVHYQIGEITRSGRA
jgi:hypothetical protein